MIISIRFIVFLALAHFFTTHPAANQGARSCEITTPSGQAEQKRAAASGATSEVSELAAKAAQRRSSLTWDQQNKLDRRLLIALYDLKKPTKRYFNDIQGLLNEGANPNFELQSDRRFYDFATTIDLIHIQPGTPKQVSSRLLQLFKLLKEYGYDFNKEAYPGSYGETVLRVALQTSNKTPNQKLKSKLFYAILTFVDLGADPNNKLFGSYTAFFDLEIADFSVQQYVQLIKSFLKHGSDINQKDSMGSTLFYAANSRGNYDLVRALMQLDANPFIVNHSGRTALDLLNLHIENSSSSNESWQQKALAEEKKFKPELEAYMRTYKEKHAKEISAGTPLPLPVSGVVAEYLLGEQPRRAESSAAPTVSQEDQLQEVD